MTRKCDRLPYRLQGRRYSNQNEYGGDIRVRYMLGILEMLGLARSWKQKIKSLAHYLLLRKKDLEAMTSC